MIREAPAAQRLFQSTLHEPAQLLLNWPATQYALSVHFHRKITRHDLTTF
jgi:hypothetical protein